MPFKTNLYSSSGQEKGYFERLGSVKGFFKPFYLTKWLSYGWGVDVKPVTDSFKAMEAPFHIPAALANGIAIFNPDACNWKKISHGIKMVKSTVQSIRWINKQSIYYGFNPLLSETGAAILEKMFIFGKIFDAGWKTAESASRLAELAEITPSSGWEEKELERENQAWNLSLTSNIIKLLIALGLVLALFFGVIVSASLLLFFYSLSLTVSIANRFFDKKEKKCPSNNLWGTLL